MKSAEEYFQKICLSIKDKDLHTLIRAEIEDHISEAKESGITTEQALEQLGDPILLGKSFEDIYQPKIDYLFITGLTLVFLMGILLQFQLGIMFVQHLVFTCIGLFAGILLYFQNLRRFIPLMKYALPLAVAMGGFVLLLGDFYNQQPYLNLWILRIRVFDALPFLVLVGMAGYIKNKNTTIWQPVLLLGVFAIFSVFAAANVELILIGLSLLLFTVLSSRIPKLLFLLGLGCSSLGVLNFNYFMELSNNHALHTDAALFSLGNFFGYGIVICFVLAFALILSRLLKSSSKAINPQIRGLLIMSSFYIAFHCLWTVGVWGEILPSPENGITPFLIGYSGTANIALLVTLGLLFSCVARNAAWNRIYEVENYA